MLLPRFNYYEPLTISEALEFKSAYGDRAKLLAGGTDLMVHMKKRLVSPEQVIYLGRIEALSSIDETPEAISIGACVTVTDLGASPVIQEKLPALKAGALCLGSLLVRNRATIGGNINSARPAADLLPSLIVYGASVVLESMNGSRQVSLESFIKGPGITMIHPDEIMTKIIVPVPVSNSGAAYLQLGKRKSQEINIVNVASWICLDSKGTIADSRIALGSVGPTPLRAFQAESFLTGKIPEESVFLEAGEKARHEDCRPIDDFRGSAAYRKAMVGILTKRTLQKACQR